MSVEVGDEHWIAPLDTPLNFRDQESVEELDALDEIRQKQFHLNSISHIRTREYEKTANMRPPRGATYATATWSQPI